MAKKNGQTRRSRHTEAKVSGAETKHRQQSREGTVRARAKRQNQGGEYVSKPSWRENGVRYQRGSRHE